MCCNNFKSDLKLFNTFFRSPTFAVFNPFPLISERIIQLNRKWENLLATFNEYLGSSIREFTFNSVNPPCKETETVVWSNTTYANLIFL